MPNQASLGRRRLMVLNTIECVLLLQMCSLTTECVLLLQNVFSYYRMCSLTGITRTPTSNGPLRNFAGHPHTPTHPAPATPTLTPPQTASDTLAYTLRDSRLLLLLHHHHNRRRRRRRLPPPPTLVSTLLSLDRPPSHDTSGPRASARGGWGGGSEPTRVFVWDCGS